MVPRISVALDTQHSNSMSMSLVSVICVLDYLLNLDSKRHISGSLRPALTSPHAVRLASAWTSAAQDSMKLQSLKSDGPVPPTTFTMMQCSVSPAAGMPNKAEEDAHISKS